MKKINKKRGILIIFLAMYLLVYAGLISAVGISKEYHGGNPAKIGPGETKEIVFGKLMASQETEDRTIELEILEGAEITSLEKTTIIVTAGSTDKEIKIQVSIPEDTEIGKEYTISIKVNDVTEIEGEGMVGFTESKISSIPVLVALPEESSEELNIWWIILGIVAVIVIIVIIYYLWKKKQEQIPTTPAKTKAPLKPLKK